MLFKRSEILLNLLNRVSDIMSCQNNWCDVPVLKVDHVFVARINVIIFELHEIILQPLLVSFHTKANYVNSLFNDAMLQLLRADHGVNQNVN